MSVILYRREGQAPPPSKDFFQLIVTERSVDWRSWRISIRNSSKIPPRACSRTWEEFVGDELLISEITQIFGKEIVHEVLEIMGKRSFQHLPENLTSISSSASHQS